MKKTYNSKKVRGFTLVELIVVISIITVLACIIVPSLISYVRKARCTAAIADARVVITGVQSTLVEKTISTSLYLMKDTTIKGQPATVGGVTNTVMYNVTHNTGSTNQLDKDIAKSILEICSNAGMNFGSSNKPFGQKCIDVVSTTDNKGKKTNYGMIIMYSNSGEVPFAQIYHNGILVTYAYGKYIANDSSSARFIGYDTAFSQPFKDIGMQDSEIPEEIKTSKTPTSSSWNK